MHFLLFVGIKKTQKQNKTKKKKNSNLGHLFTPDVKQYGTHTPTPPNNKTKQNTARKTKGELVRKWGGGAGRGVFLLVLFLDVNLFLFFFLKTWLY